MLCLWWGNEDQQTLRQWAIFSIQRELVQNIIKFYQKKVKTSRKGESSIKLTISSYWKYTESIFFKRFRRVKWLNLYWKKYESKLKISALDKSLYQLKYCSSDLVISQ